MKKEKQSYQEWVAERRRITLWMIPFFILIPSSASLLREFFGITSIGVGIFVFVSSIVFLFIYGFQSWRDAEKAKKELQKRHEEEDAALLQQLTQS